MFPGINGAPAYAAFTAHQYPAPGASNEYWLYFGWGKPSVTSTIMGWRLGRN
jgi:hypothetical protein